MQFQSMLPDVGQAVITSDEVLAALREIRVPLITQESDLQGMVAGRLTDAGIPHRREVQLGPGNRIDFLVGAVGIECKKGKPNRTRLLTQLERYCQSPQVAAIIVVVPWQRHLYLPEQIKDKPVHVLSLNRLWGVAL